VPTGRHKTGTAGFYDFKVLLFLPGMSPSGIRARLSFRDGVLEFNGPGVWITLLADQVSLGPGGFDGRQWVLSWHTKAGPASALLKGEADILLMRRMAPPALAAQIERGLEAMRQRDRRLRWLIALALVAVVLPFLAVALFWLNSERIAGWAAGHVSLRDEQRLGRLVFAQMQPGLKLIEQGPALRMLRELGGRLTQGSAYDYRWYLAESPEINAFAIPGGHVVVYTGLLRLAHGPEEVAGVLAHEVQHVEARHTLENLMHALGWRAVLSVALGDFGGGVWAGMAHRLVTLEYGRDQEREADLKALEGLRRAGIAPDGLVGSLEKLARMEGMGVALLASHPTSEQRIHDLRGAIAALGGYPVQALAYDWDAIQRSLRD
jgi:Zn-dependent protease with chaperone function